MVEPAGRVPSRYDWKFRPPFFALRRRRTDVLNPNFPPNIRPIAPRRTALMSTPPTAAAKFGRSANSAGGDMFSGIGLIAFSCICCAALAGFLIGRRLSEDNRSEGTQRVVQLVMNVVGILTALVLGLLIASTKTNFDTTSNQVEQFATNLALLDRELIQLGPDARPVRDLLREFSSRKIALVWPAERWTRPKLHDNETDEMLDDMQGRLRSSSPQNEAQRMTRAEALRILGELKRTNRLLAVQVNIRTPLPFLAVVIFWLCVLFLSYAAFAPVNKVVLGAMIISAASVSIALNVIIDMDRPFVGIIKISSASMRQALDDMKP
jgi:hypothetical protein